MEFDAVSIAMIALVAVPLVLLGSGAWASTATDRLEQARWSPERVWKGRDGDDGSIHCIGNGDLCVYAQGPDIIQLFGPTYSTQSIGRIDLATPGVEVRSRRVFGAAVWRHEVMRAGKTIAVVTDFVDSASPCLVRHVRAEEALDYTIAFVEDMEVSRGGAFDDGLIARMPMGAPVFPYAGYPIPFPVYHQFVGRGAASIEKSDDACSLRFAPGESWLFVAGGPSMPEAVEHAEAALAAGYDALLGRTLDTWAAFTAKGRDFESELPKDLPLRERLVQVLDDYAVLTRAQQGVEGGILAGYPYHLAYVRDQYGTYRGVWSTGHHEMSRAILEFYYNVFAKSGMIRNAQAFGIDGLFHVHENDDVEITGYIMLQAFHYLEQSGDQAFIDHIFPMLQWGWEVQQKHLVKNMLPFNGDETYVAGGILPRTTLNDGSAEATMLFIDSGDKLIDYAEAHGQWDAAAVAKARAVLAPVKAAYRENFWRDGRLITNNPARREDPGALPRFRKGVCENGCGVVWTMKNDNDRYVCIRCFEKAPLPRVEPEVYTLQSVSLTPLYFHSELFDKAELKPVVDELVAAYEKTGQLPSRPDSNIAVGYDYGLLLYAMVEVGHPAASALYEKTLELADPTGAWSEYYQDHRPRSTRCRPWESGINVEALLHYVETVWDGK